MTTPEAALAAALHDAGIGCLRPLAASRDVCVPGTRPGSIHDEAPGAILAALHDAGYALTPLAPEVPPRRFARGLVNTPADQIEVLRGALDLVARRLHEFHTGLERFDDCERDTCRYARRALGTAALSLPIQTGATGTPPDSGDGAGIDAALLAEALPDALSAMTEGDDETPAPQPSDEPGSPYVVGLARALAARLRSGSPAPEGGE